MPSDSRHDLPALPYALAAAIAALAVYSALTGDSFASMFRATAWGLALAAILALPFSGKAPVSVRDDARPTLGGNLSFFVRHAPAAVVVCGIVAGAASLAAWAWAPQAAGVGTRVPLGFGLPSSVAVLVVYYLMTGLFEELLMRLVAFRGFVAAWRSRFETRNPVFPAAVLSAAVFALLHASGPGAQGAVEWAQVALKAMSAFQFGLVMCACYAKSGSIAKTGLLHAVFDMASCIPCDLAAGGVAATYLTGLAPDAAAGALTCALLVAPSVQAARALASQARIL